LRDALYRAIARRTAAEPLAELVGATP
jgi:hypothetical protein